MWPFNRKTEKTKSSRQILVEEMQAWRKVGETFTYLGRECVVTGYATWASHAKGIGVRVELQADYADDLGVIRSVVFTPREWRALAEKQPNAGSGDRVDRKQV